MDYPILDAVPDADRRAVLGAARRRRFARNEVILHEGDPGDSLHLPAKGHVAIRVTTPLGDAATVRILRPKTMPSFISREDGSRLSIENGWRSRARTARLCALRGASSVTRV